jgi:hypothetical protein
MIFAYLLHLSWQNSYNYGTLVPYLVSGGGINTRCCAKSAPGHHLKEKGGCVSKAIYNFFASHSPLFAVDTTLYSSTRHSLEETVKNLFNTPHAAVNRLPLETLVILYCAASNCMRISEVLQLRPSQYIGNNRFAVFGAKRSASYMIEMAVIVEHPGWRTDPRVDEPFLTVGYPAVWRWCRVCGIGFTPDGHKNVARTHSHRYLTARAVNAAVSGTVAGDVLHHRGKSSVQFYL